MVLGLLLVGVATVLAADQAPSLDVTVPTAAVSVGDRVAVQVAARGTGDLQWGNLKVAVAADGDWAVVDGPREVAGSAPPAWEVVLAPLAVGEVQLPELSTTAREPGGEAVEVTPAELPKVTVASVLPAAEGGEAAAPEARPLRAPLGVHGLPWEWLLPALAVLVPLAAAGWWLWRRRRRRDDGLAPRRQLAPWPELEALGRELRERIGRAGPDEVCDRLAHGLRRYLERRTGEPALEMTSFELRLLGRRRGFADEVQRGVQQATTLVDAVRFGRRPAIEDELERALDAALAAARAYESQLAPPTSDERAEATA